MTMMTTMEGIKQGGAAPPAFPLSPSKKLLKREKTRDCLSACSEHVSSSSPYRNAKPLVVRRATSLSTPGHSTSTGKVVIGGGRMTGRVKLVSFQQEARVMGLIPTREEMEEDDIVSSIWYSKDDFKGMKRDYLPIVKKLAKKLPLEEDEEARGLEHKTPRGCKSRQKNRFQAMDAVLDEQERQWEVERKDPNYIAQIYRQSSAHCQMNAYLLAKKDAEFVEQEIKLATTVETKELSTEEDWGNDIPPEKQLDVVRPSKYRPRAPDESPTTPVRKEPSKKVCILSPQLVVPPTMLRSV